MLARCTSAPLRLHLRRVQQQQQQRTLNQTLASLPRPSRLAPAASAASARLPHHGPLRAGSGSVRRKAGRVVAARATASMSTYEAELQKGYEAVELASRLCEVRIIRFQSPRQGGAVSV